ncbi:MAG: hypothetical protein RR942_04705 [Romboutsia sp.]
MILIKSAEKVMEEIWDSYGPIDTVCCAVKVVCDIGCFKNCQFRIDDIDTIDENKIVNRIKQGIAKQYMKCLDEDKINK